MVDNSDAHAGFENFQATISQAAVKQSFNFDWSKGKSIDETQVKVDGKTIGDSWQITP